MRLSNEKYEEIKNIVADMFVFYGIENVPINSFDVAAKMGLTIIPYSSLSAKRREESQRFNEDGYSVETNEGEWIIYYNDLFIDSTRINQTIMHEIGHYILGHTKDGEEEAEARFLAKYALASPPLIHNLKEKDVDSIMKTFAIGYEAATIALENYRTWLKYGAYDYTSYERKIMIQIGVERLRR